MAQLADIGLIEKYAEDLKNLLCDSSLAEQKSFIRSFVKEVRITGGATPHNLSVTIWTQFGSSPLRWS